MSDHRPTRRQVLRIGGFLGLAGVAGCSQVGGSGGSDAVSDTDGDGVIDTEDYAPWDEEVQEKSQLTGSESAQAVTPTERESATDTPTGDGTVEYTFEDGLEGWVPVWAGPSDCPDQPGLRHETSPPVIDGSGSALFTTECDSNMVAGPAFDVDASRDFTVSVDFYFEDDDSRGLFVHLYGSDRNGSANDRVRAGEHSHTLVRARRWPAKNQQAVSAVGHETRVQQGTIDPGTRHTLVGHKRGDTVTATLDGEAFVERRVGEATWNAGDTYRVMLVHSGAWGAPSRIWFDSVSVSHG